MNTSADTTTIPASQLIPGDCMWDPKTEKPLVVLWREMRAFDGRILLVLAFPDGLRVNRTLTRQPGGADIPLAHHL